MFSQALVLAACALGAVAQSTTTAASTTANTATATILIGSATTGLAASIVAADSCDTTYQLICTDTAACSGYALTFTVTEGPTDYQFAYATSTAGATGSVAESCSLSGSSYAVCSQGISLSAGGTSTSTSTTTTISGTMLNYAQFPITAGGSKIAAATGACSVSGNAAAPTGVSQVYKVLVVPAAAAVLAAGML